MVGLRGLLRFVLSEFGPLIAFLLLNAAFGLRVAIAGTVATVAADIGRRLWQGTGFTRLYILSSTLALVFGTIDLFAATPFMLKYEAVITNLATGIFFAAGARGGKPLLQEIAEQRQGGAFPERADVRRFFQLFTLAWAAYFFTKATVYLWLGEVMRFENALALRSVIGSVSMAVMLAVSITQGRRLFFLCRWLGLLPAVPEESAGAGR